MKQPAASTGDIAPSSAVQPAWSWRAVLWFVSIVALVTIVALIAEQGAVSDRIRNPNVDGAPRPVTYLFGVSNALYMMIVQLGTLALLLGFVVVVIVKWRRNPAHPVLLMAVTTTVLMFFDPILNWAVFAVYNPQLWHYPENWPLVSLSPTVEPLIAAGYVYFLVPYFPAAAILRRVQSRRPEEAFVWRHPLLSLAALIMVIGFAFDVVLELLSVRLGLYVFSQVIPWGSVFVGTPFQFPLIWQAILVALVMVPAGVLVYRDDTGRCVAEKLAHRTRVLPSRPAWGTFMVMCVVLVAGFSIYGGTYLLIRTNGLATAVACPWPYPEAKVYDPRGDYELAGKPGGFSVNTCRPGWAGSLP